MEHIPHRLGVRARKTTASGRALGHRLLLGGGLGVAYAAVGAQVLAHPSAHTLALGYCVAAVVLVAGAAGTRNWSLQGRRHLAPAALAMLALLVAAVGGVVLPAGAAVVALVGSRVAWLLAGWPGARGATGKAHSSQSQPMAFLGVNLIGAATGLWAGLRAYPSLGLFALLLGAAGLYLAAWLVGRIVPLLPKWGLAVSAGHAKGQQLAEFGEVGSGQPLVRALGLGLAGLVAVGVGVEYLFFKSLTQAMADPAFNRLAIGGLLTLAYLLAQLAASSVRAGISSARGVLGWVPVGSLIALTLCGLGEAAELRPGWLVGLWGAFLLMLAVWCRRVVAPIIQALLHALPAAERQPSYTRLWMTYVSLGMGGGGGLLLAGSFGAELPREVTCAMAWMCLLLLSTGWWWRRGLHLYIDALSRALQELAAGPLLGPIAVGEPVGGSPTRAATRETLRVIAYLKKVSPAALAVQAEQLLAHADRRVRARALSALAARARPALLLRLALDDAHPALRKQASRLAGRHPEADGLLLHPDAQVRQEALRGRLEARPTDAKGQAGLRAVVASADPAHVHVGLALIAYLAPAQQAELVASALASGLPELVRAAARAAVEVNAPVVIEQVLKSLGSKPLRSVIAESLRQMGTAALPVLRNALAGATDARCARLLAQACAGLGAATARQVLVEVTLAPNLHARHAALQALTSFASQPADAPGFHRLLEEEMQLAQHLLHGLRGASAELQSALEYEVEQCRQRLRAVLLQIYARPLLLAAPRAPARPGFNPPATLTALENLLPSPLYRGVLALWDGSSFAAKTETFDELLGPPAWNESVVETVIRRGAAAFFPWTVSVCLREWHPQPATAVWLYPHLLTPSLLIQETALELVHLMPQRSPGAFDALAAQHPTVLALLKNGHKPPDSTPARTRVRALKSIPLFAETPENDLAAVLPIVREETFVSGQEIFAKGSAGASMFIICAGEVHIGEGKHPLATLRTGDFFGELALLDAGPRSASATAGCGPVLALRLDQEDFYDVLEEYPPVVRAILRGFCQRLRSQNEQVPAARDPVQK